MLSRIWTTFGYLVYGGQLFFSSSGEPSKPKKRVFVEDVDDEDDGGGSGDDDDDAQPQGHDLVPVKHWQVGETCQAVWAKDGQ